MKVPQDTRTVANLMQALYSNEASHAARSEDAPDFC